MRVPRTRFTVRCTDIDREEGDGSFVKTMNRIRLLVSSDHRKAVWQNNCGE